MAPPRKSHADLVAGTREHVTIETQQGVPVRAAVEDGGTDLALARAAAAAEAGRPLRGTERRAVRHEVMAAHAAAQPQQRRPSLRERLEGMTESERFAAVAKVTPGTRERAYMEHLVRSIEEDPRRGGVHRRGSERGGMARRAGRRGGASAGVGVDAGMDARLEPGGGARGRARGLGRRLMGSAQASLAAEESDFSDDLDDGYVEDGFEEGDLSARPSRRSPVHVAPDSRASTTRSRRTSRRSKLHAASPSSSPRPKTRRSSRRSESTPARALQARLTSADRAFRA